ncbi:unnamed protein product [Sphagnum balticum]
MEPTTIDLLPTIERENLRYVRTIGKGSFAEVAEVVWLGQKVAQKIFRGFESKSFLLESNILAGLCHPNIVQIFGVWTGGRECSIVMDLMHGDLHGAINECGGPSQTFATLPFTMAPEEGDTEIETDNRARDMYTLMTTVNDLQRQLKEKERTVQDQNQTIQKLLARQGRLDNSQLEEASPVDQKLSLSFSPYQTLRENDKTLQEQGQKLQEKDQVLRKEDQAIEMLHARHATFKCQGCVVQ